LSSSNLLFIETPRPDRKSANSLRAQEGNEVQFMRPRGGGVEQPRHEVPYRLNEQGLDLAGAT